MSPEPTRTAEGRSPETVLGRVDEGVCAFDTEWRFTFVNEQAAAAIAHTAEELLGETIWEMLPGIEEEKIGQKLRGAVESQDPVRFESYSRTMDRWFRVRLYPAADGLTACFSDITDERGDQLDLQRSHHLFETVFEETEDALVIADTEGRITDVNPAAERLLGYDVEELVGESTRVLHADRDEEDHHHENGTNTDSPAQEEAHLVEYERADGTRFQGETLWRETGVPDGEPLALVASIRDVSDSVESEQNLEARNEPFRAFHEIATDEERSFDDRVKAVLELGCDRLGLDTGLLSRIEGESYTVEYAVGSGDAIHTGDVFDRETVYCDPFDERELIAVTDGTAGQLSGHPASAGGPPGSSVGVPVVVDGVPYGTLNFSADATRRPVTDGERTFLQMLAQWVGKELSRQRSRDRAQSKEQRLRQIIDMLPQLVFAKDSTGKFLLANEAIADAYGTTVEELEGATDAEFASSAEEARQFREDDRAVIESGERKDIPEEPLTTADGDKLVMQTTKIPYEPVDHERDAVLGVATDITGLKQRDDQIELQSEAMEVAMDGIAIIDDGEYVYMNQKHADIFGHEPAELVGSDWHRLYEDGEIERFESEVFPALAEDGEWRGEAVGQRADGTPVQQDLGLSLLDSGELICTNRDISDQKEREQELARQRTRLRALFDESPDSVIIHDDEGAVIDANHTAADILGLDRETLLSMNVAEFESGIDQSELESIWAELDKEETLKVEGEHVREGGETFPVEVWVNKAEVDGNERYIAVSRDITARKEREQELKRNRNFIEKAQESASIGGWEADLSTDSLRWTDEVYRIHDLPLDAEVSLDDGIAFYHLDDRSTIQDAFERLTTEGESYDLELRLDTAADRVRWVRAVGDPVVEDGEIVGARGVFQDITERKEREQELRELKERLDLAVEGADIGIWDWDMETDAVTFNEQWAAMLGFSLDEIEPTFRTWEDRVHPADMPHVESELEAYFAGETALYDCEHRMQTKDGEWKWIRTVGKAVEREDGEPTRAVGIHLDITEQKRSALYLEDERDMFAQGPAVVFKWQNDDGWPVEYVSENVAETFGYTPEQLQSGDVPYTELIHDDDIGRIEQEVERNSDQTTDRFSHDPYRMVTSSGEVRWVTDNTKIIRNDGEITHYLGYLIDITEQKRLEQSLRESEQSLRELTAVASDTGQSFEEKLTTLLELGRDRLDVPYAFLNRLDDETQHVVQAVGDHPELQTGADAPRSETYCRKTVQQDGVLDVQDAVEEGWEGDPGYERFELGCYIGGTVVVDGDRYGTLCFADQASRDHGFDDNERAFVELLVQWVSYELAGEEFETKLEELNDTARRLMAAPSEEEIAAITIESVKSVLDMPINGIWWHDESTETLVPGGMTEESAAAFSEQPTLESGESVAYDVFEVGRARTYDDLDDIDGLHNEDTILSSEAIIPLGEFGVVTAGSVDTRAFSETDLNLLQVLSATVEAALNRAQREEMLRETQEQLKQSNEELEQFAYAASHDLQEPLRTVSSYMTLLERRYGDELDEDATDFIEFAVDGADRMREMIQALLAYSRVDTRGQEFEPVSVAALFERIEQDLTVTIDEADATLSTPSTDTTVAGDRNQLSQLFQNLVENGIKYNEGKPHIDVSATRNGETVRVEVTDNGIGMAPEQTDDIFEVFQRLHTREEFAGTGIGLSICRKIVDRHGGEIDVESTPGEGSTFVVTLPRGERSDE
jgi:PAS domain S-box-containing protein